jgi:pSer/pThr/pTyr-binding forkhead associated (FHA) protein
VDAYLVGLSQEIAGQRFALAAETAIGRGTHNHVQLQHYSIAGSHVRIHRDADRYVLEDLGTSNGAMVNGRRVQSAELASGDIVRIGFLELRFERAP